MTSKEFIADARAQMQRIVSDADMIEAARNQMDMATQTLTHRIEALYGQIAALRIRISIMEGTLKPQDGRSS